MWHPTHALRSPWRTIRRVFRRLHPKRREVFSLVNNPPQPIQSDPPAAAAPTSIPIEVLQHIFELATKPTCIDLDLEEKKAIRTTILACSQVCQLWRSAARGYNVLWVHAADFQGHALDIITDFVQLSSPLPITLGHRSQPFHIDQPKDLEVLDFLKSIQHRIWGWNVHYADAVPPQRRLVHSPKGWSTLEEFRWEGLYSVPEQVEGEWCIASLGRTPALYTLCVKETNFRLAPSMRHNHLTALSVCNLSLSSRLGVRDWLSILRNTPRLQLLSVHNATVQPSAEDRALIHQLPATSRADLALVRFLSLGLNERQLFLQAFQGLFLFSPLCGLGFDIYQHRISNRGVGHVLRDRLQAASQIYGHHAIPQLEFTLGRDRDDSQSLSAHVSTLAHPAANMGWSYGDRGIGRIIDSLETIVAESRFPPVIVRQVDLTVEGYSQLLHCSGHLLSRATTVRITADQDGVCPRILNNYTHEFLSRAFFVMRALVALVVLVHMLLPVLTAFGDMRVNRLMIPTLHALPSLRFIVIEGGSLQSTGSDSATRRLLDEYVTLRRDAGSPVSVISFGVEKGSEDRALKRRNRRGMVPLL